MNASFFLVEVYPLLPESYSAFSFLELARCPCGLVLEWPFSILNRIFR